MKRILYNGVIHTMDPENPEAEAVLFENGIIKSVGTNTDILSLADDDTITNDLHGAAMYPGLTDTHLHILNKAVTDSELVLNDIRERKQLFRIISEATETAPQDAVLDGRGFNEDTWDEKRLPTRKELDAVSHGRAVRITRVCGHLAIANSAAINAAGITYDTPVPFGGQADLENGIFCENALGLIFRDKANDSVSACKEYLYKGMCRAADSGLTAIYSDDFGSGGFPMRTVIEAYRQLDNEGRMPVRVVEQCALGDSDAFREFLDSGLRYGSGDGLFSIGPRKLFADGSLGARTAWMLTPYRGTGSFGVACYTQEQLNTLAVESHEARMPFIVHAIGSAAVDSVIKAIRYARANVPGTDDLRDGIVHCQITDRSLLAAILAEKVCVYAQPVFTEYDLHICRDRIGEELEKTSYAWKTLYDGGCLISSGSDCPVEPLDPAKNIYCAVSRKDFDHFPSAGWNPSERLSVYEAIACHTVKAAECVNRENVLGKIKPGFQADFSIFDRDFFTTEPDDLTNIKPVMTVVEGRIRRCGH